MAKILLMEDEPNHIFIVQHSLKRIGHEVVACSHPNNFIKILKQTQPSLILMDINLPEIDGISLIKKVRTFSEYDDIPIIVLTAVPIDDVREEAKSSGSNIFLEKPIRIATLRRIVSETLDPNPDLQSEEVALIKWVPVETAMSVKSDISLTLD